MQTILKLFGDQRHVVTPERIPSRLYGRHRTIWHLAELETYKRYRSYLQSKIPQRRARFVRYGLLLSGPRRDHAKLGTKMCPRLAEDQAYGGHLAVHAW